MSSAGHLSAGQVFGRYQIIRVIGEGGMGAVYEAIHTGLKKRVAIKTLLPSIAQNPDAQARFLREGEAASRMNHPNVVDVTDVGSEDGIPYLVMEYLEGENLADLIDRKGPLPIAMTVDLMLPVLTAVAAGHDEGVIHRDLKPANIFLSRGPWGEPIPKVLDFGVSKIVDGQSAALTGTMAVLGTASYMSPEQARGAKVVEAASDQYALGLILYEMLTAQRAHDGEHPLEVLHRIASGVIPDARPRRPDLTPELDGIMKRMLSMNPRDRFASLRDVGRALIRFASDKARITYADAFREAGGAGPEPTLSGTAPKRPISASNGGTRLLPSSGSAQNTTLGQSAVETFGSLAPRKSRGPLLALAVVLAGGGAAAFVITRASSQGGAEAVAPTTAAAPGPAPAAELPAAPPAAAELPHPAAPVTPPPPPPPVAPRAPAPEPAHAPEAKHPSAPSHASSHHAAPKKHETKDHGGGGVSKGENGAPIID
jgi:serine/threonine-protein kinase